MWIYESKWILIPEGERLRWLWVYLSFLAPRLRFSNCLWVEVWSSTRRLGFFLKGILGFLWACWSPCRWILGCFGAIFVLSGMGEVCAFRRIFPPDFGYFGVFGPIYFVFQKSLYQSRETRVFKITETREKGSVRGKKTTTGKISAGKDYCPNACFARKIFCPVQLEVEKYKA